MNKEDVFQRVQNVFDKIFLEPVKVTPDLSANDVDEWDSLIQISLIVAIEKEFSIRFRTGEVETTANVGEFADLILKKINEF
jgi:acyl carrier protein